MKKISIFWLLFGALSTQAQLQFRSLDSLLRYADRQSASAKISAQQTLLAKWTKVAALANSVNFRDPVSFSATNNLQLPVNFIPAEAFGGPAGSFREITLGQQYVSNFNFNPQIDIINPANWARIQSAQTNKELTELSNQINKKALHESIAAAYHNIVSLQQQVQIVEKSSTAADSVLLIARNKYDQGLIRTQDLNNVTANKLSVNDKLNQLKYSLRQQENSLKILCDIPAQTAVSISIENPRITSEAKSSSDLQQRYSALQRSFAKSELTANRASMLPVVSLVYYQGWQKNSNTGFSDANSRWIPSKYIGLRVSVPFPPDVNKMSQSYTTKVNYKIAELSAEHNKLQNELSNSNLDLDREKALSGFDLASQVEELKKTNYQTSLNQYHEGLLSTEFLLTAFTDLLNSSLNKVSAEANLFYVQSKIMINNSLK